MAPAIDRGSIDAALVKIRQLRSKMEAVNFTTVALRVERGRLGHTLRGIPSETGVK